MRNNTLCGRDTPVPGGTPCPDDDTQLFLACNALPSSPLACPDAPPPDSVPPEELYESVQVGDRV